MCKGSTTDFDSVCLGSNPGNPTKTKKPQQNAEAFFMGGNESRGLRGLVQKVQWVQEGVEDFQPLQDFRLPMLVFSPIIKGAEDILDNL